MNVPNNLNLHGSKMEFSIKDFFSKCDEIGSFLQIWSHLLKKFLKENLMLHRMLDMVKWVINLEFTTFKLMEMFRHLARGN